MSQILEIMYTNYRGETSLRRITPHRVWFGMSSPWHPDRQWMLTVFDHDKNVLRDFAFSGLAPTDTQIMAHPKVKALVEYFSASEAMLAIEAKWRQRKAEGGLLDGLNIFKVTDALTEAESRLNAARAALRDLEGGRE